MEIRPPLGARLMSHGDPLQPIKPFDLQSLYKPNNWLIHTSLALYESLMHMSSPASCPLSTPVFYSPLKAADLKEKHFIHTACSAIPERNWLCPRYKPSTYLNETADTEIYNIFIFDYFSNLCCAKIQSSPHLEMDYSVTWGDWQYIILCFVCFCLCINVHVYVLLGVELVQMFKSWISEWPNENYMSIVCALVGPHFRRSPNLIRFQPNTAVPP